MSGISQTPDQINADIAIVGGGIAGGTLACLLAAAGLRVVLIDREDPAARLDRDFDIRTTALSYGSRNLVMSAGYWEALAAHASPIEHIRIADGTAPVFLDFKSEAVDGRAFGWIVENRLIRQALANRIASLPDLQVLAPATVTSYQPQAGSCRLTLADGRTVKAALAVGADGRGSTMRELAGIGLSTTDYKQTALAFIVAHQHDHGQVAVEHFQPAGPFAVLPMTDDAGVHRSSVVWTVAPAEAERLMALDETTFDAELQPVFNDYWGETHVLGRRAAYPLALTHAMNYTSDRLALVADAAHGIHPIAGQGLNLGLRDVALLTEIVTDAARLGLDIGSQALLRRYETGRRGDNGRMVFATDTLNRLFSNEVAPVRMARAAGLAMIEQLPPVKRFFMLTAMGVGGQPPRLIRGERL